MATTRDGSDLGINPMAKNARAAVTAAKKAMMVPANSKRHGLKRLYTYSVTFKLIYKYVQSQRFLHRMITPAMPHNARHFHLLTCALRRTSHAGVRPLMPSK